MYCMLTDITGVINNPKYVKYNEICLVFIRYKYLISPIEIVLLQATKIVIPKKETKKTSILYLHI